MQTSPVINLLVAIAFGVAGAVVAVAGDSVIADVVGGVVGLVALAVVIRSALQLAGEAGTPDDGNASQHP